MKCVENSANESCCKDQQSYSSLKEIVDVFKDRYFHMLEKELDHYKNISLEVAIQRASKVEMAHGKKHSHQYRIRQTALDKIAINLGGISEIEWNAAKMSFDDVHELVDTTITEIPGVGELTIYDTAVRVATYFGLEPQCVYLHRGTLEGAKYLLPKIKKQRKLDKSELPQELRCLSADMIESLLCIYKVQLYELSQR